MESKYFLDDVLWNLPLQAIVALTFAQYAAKPFFPDCEAPADAVRLLAAVCLGMFHYLNIFLFIYRKFNLLKWFI